MQCEFKFISSLDKVFFDWEDSFQQVKGGSTFQNEIHSFQLVGYLSDTPVSRKKFNLEIESELKEYITVQKVGYVPSRVPCMPECRDEDYLSKRPGLFPDPLFALSENQIELFGGQARSFWISVEPKSVPGGIYPIRIQIRNELGETVGDLTYKLEVLNAELPESRLKNTGWFHGDCIAMLHGTETLSERHYELLEKYIAVYVKFGHNMILTPLFTPPLDTAVGGERPTIQLVGVIVENGRYKFEFAHLKKWVDICCRNGIKYFEMTHFFTQWGAGFAPKIMATVDGCYRQIFGWNTPADSPEYVAFLKQFLPELLRKLLEFGLSKEQCYFHVSDEPGAEHLENYQRAKAIIEPYLQGYPIIDALSSYELYTSGAVEKPVVSTNHVRPFLENGVRDFWVYYCTSQGEDVANRYMAMPSYRNRILGWQLYKYQIDGFLQWGFNFWYSQYSLEVINPYVTTDAGGGFQSGDAFVVYPTDGEDRVVCSLRLYVFNEGMNDFRALCMLEQYMGREAVIAWLDEIVGFDRYPRQISYILNLRERVNQKIKEYL